MRPQHDDGTARTPSATVPRRRHAVTNPAPVRHGASARVAGPAVRCGAVIPNGARPATPPSSAVSTHGPSGVMATVCSKCAAREPSLVTTVQPSSSSTVAGSPTVTIGSIASARPGHELRAAAGPAVVEHVRVLVHLGADAVAAVVVDDPVGVRLGGDRLLDGGADVGQPPAGDRPGQPGPHRPLGHVEQRGVLGRGLPHRHGDGGVAVPALRGSRRSRWRCCRPRPARAVGARDAVHDLVVDRGADACR